MVHNGIEYGDMQLICEAYDLLKHGLGLTPDELHDVFAEWNKGELDSYLIEISSQIFAKKDEDGTPLVDKILDTAGQKGTGKWTVDQRARPRPARHADRRVGLRALPVGPQGRARGRLEDPAGAQPATPLCRRPRQSSSRMCAARSTARKIISYAQGYMLLREPRRRSTAGT